MGTGELYPPRSINGYRRNLTNCWGVTCDELASRPEGVEILLASGNRDKLRPDEPVGLKGFTLSPLRYNSVCLWSCCVTVSFCSFLPLCVLVSVFVRGGARSPGEADVLVAPPYLGGVCIGLVSITGRHCTTACQSP